VKTRYQKLRKGILSTKHLYDYIDRHAKLVSQATDRHFKEYPELLESGEGGSQFNPVGMFANYRVSSYDEEIKVVKKWLADRLAFLDKNIDRFDKDWEPRIQEPVEKKMQFNGFPGMPQGGFPGGGFPNMPPGGGFPF
jgi:hypothetical protein